MFKELKPYEDVRAVGLPWLETLPPHWHLARAKQVLRSVDVRSERGEEELLTVSSHRGVVPRSSEKVTMFQAASYAGHKMCRPGDLVINSLWAWGRGLGVSPVHGLVSPAYGVYRARNSASVDMRFIHELVRSNQFNWELTYRSRGVWKSRLQLTDDRFLAAPLPIPPADEQAAIIKYLGHAHARIDRTIVAKRKLITLLEEQKRAVIHQAVTRGPDPTVPLKDSGVPWLGKIPAHWSVSRVAREFDVLDRLRIPLSAEVRGEMTSRVYDYYGASGVIDKVDGYLFDEPTILIAEDGANLVLRNLPLAIRAEGKYWVNNHAHILRPRRGDLGFLASLLETIDFRPWISGAAQPKLTQDRLKGIAIALPTPAEQAASMSFIEQQVERQTNAIAVARREMELLREYRARLTSDVVTGQADVREIAATLPELTEEMLLDSGAEDLDTIMEDAEEFLEEVDA